MEVLADMEYPLSGTVRHRRAFGDLGPFPGEHSFAVDAALVWDKSIAFARDVWMVMGHPSGSSAIDSADEKAGWDP